MEFIERVFALDGQRTADTREANGLGLIASPDPTDPIAEWWMSRARALEGVIFDHIEGVRRQQEEEVARPALTSQRLAEALTALFAETIIDVLRHPPDRRRAFRAEAP